MKWKMVPVEPTEAMLAAGHSAWDAVSDDGIEATALVYGAMLYASPSGAGEVVAWISEREIEFLRDGSYRTAMVVNFEDDHRVPLYASPQPASGIAPAVSDDMVKAAGPVVRAADSDEFWRLKIQDVAVELFLMGKAWDHEALKTFTPCEKQHLVAAALKPLTLVSAAAILTPATLKEE